MGFRFFKKADGLSQPVQDHVCLFLFVFLFVFVFWGVVLFLCGLCVVVVFLFVFCCCCFLGGGGCILRGMVTLELARA